MKKIYFMVMLAVIVIAESCKKENKSANHQDFSIEGYWVNFGNEVYITYDKSGKEIDREETNPSEEAEKGAERVIVDYRFKSDKTLVATWINYDKDGNKTDYSTTTTKYKISNKTSTGFILSVMDEISGEVTDFTVNINVDKSIITLSNSETTEDGGKYITTLSLKRLAEGYKNPVGN